MYLQQLRALIAHCQSPEAVGYTPSDFPLARLSQKQLDVLVGSQKRDIEAIYPLSPLQQGLLFHTLYAPEGGDYVNQLRFTLQGDLDEMVVLEAWRRVIARHAILRTAFVWEGLEEPHQVVSRQVELPQSHLDWRAMSSQEQEMQLQRYLQQDRERNFELATAPLLRLTLIRLAEQRYECLWTHHHILLDGWSMPMVLNAFFASYAEIMQGQTGSRTGPRPYQEYIAWLQRQDGRQAEIFWRKTLRGFRHSSSLSIESAPDQQGSKEHSYREQSVLLTREQTAALQHLARQEHLTLNTLLQGAWALLLACLSGQRDLVFGTVVSGRPAELPGVEQMVGLFINTVPLRVRLRPEQSLLSWLHELQEQQSQQRQYEYSSLAQVQSWSEMPAGTALFETLFVYENYPVQPQGQEGVEGQIRIEAMHAVEQTHYPLSLVTGPGEQILLKCLYDSNRFAPETIDQQILQRMPILISHMLLQSEQAVGRLSLLSEQEYALLVGQWQRRSGAYPAEATLSDLFEEQVASQPEAIALVSAEQQVSYGELDRRASLLAAALQDAGVDAEVGVGICLERSVQQIVGLLGILKAGGYYVPLEPHAPLERQRFLIQDAHVRLILSTEPHREQLMQVAPHDVPVWRLDEADAAWLREQKESGRGFRDARTLAYVLYTSGSTGRPKGVSVSQQAVVRLVKGNWFVDLNAQEVLLYQAPLAFDASTLELWGSLLNGARLVIGAAELQSVEALGQQLQEEQVSTLWLTAGLFHQMVQEQAALAAVRQVLAGGDALGGGQVRALLELGRGEAW